MKPWLQILRKELREMFRDKRVMRSVFVAPFLVILVLFTGLGALIDKVSKKELEELYVMKGGANTSITKALSVPGKTKVIEVASPEEAKNLIEKGKAKVVLEFPATFEDDLKAGKGNIVAYFDSVQETSQIALSRISAVIDATNKKVLEQTLAAKGIPPDAIEPLKIDKRDQAKKDAAKNVNIASLLPYLIVLYAFTGGMSVAADAVAGEKERGTLETLLLTPISRFQIVFGKFVGLALICFFASMTGVLSRFVIVALNLPGSKTMFASGAGVSAGGMLAIVLAIFAYVTLLASLLLGVSALAKNMKEAQSFLGVLSIFVIMPAVMSQVIGLTDFAKQIWINAVPVLGTATVIKEAFLGTVKPEGVGICLLSNLTLAALAMAWAVWLFRREQILVRS